MDNFLAIDINTLLTGILILVVWSWMNKKQSRDAPSAATLKLIEGLEETLRGLVQKVAEINVRQDGHEAMVKVFHRSLEKQLDRLAK